MASVLAIIINNSNELLLIRRPGDLKFGTAVSGRPGQWCLPGGKIKDKECPEEAVVREVEEEVGLEVVPIRKLADFGDQFYFHCAFTKEMWVRPNPRECSDYAWVSPVNISSIGFISDFRRLSVVLSLLNSDTNEEQVPR